jgi:hypothetical protein
MQRDAVVLSSVVNNPASFSADLPAVRHPDSYAPGPIRTATDNERAAVSAFIAAHPEYAKLPDDAIVQAMSTYRTEEDHAQRQRVHDEGVPVGWRPADHDEPNDGDEDSLARV